jgi:hypothetical protein
MIHKFKSSFLLGITLGLGVLSANAQMHVNGPIAFGSSLFSTSFGNLSFGPDAQVVFIDGTTFYMLGEATTLDPGAEIFANTLSSQSGTGRILFQGSVAQALSGGNSSAIGGAQPSFINIAVNNSNNLSLTSTNTRVTSGLDFVDGHIVLGSNNLEIASAATITNADETQYVVTNGTGFLAKEAFTSAFNFPVGRAVSDYTPATITPTTSDDFFVQVKNYAESASEETIPDNGIFRTWNIYSVSGNGMNLTLQHNTSTNGSSFISSSGFVTQYQGLVLGSGVWQIGSGANTSDALGTVASSRIHSRLYSTSATNNTSNEAFFSKSSNELKPLPITLLDFDAKKHGEKQSIVTWRTSTEVNSSHFDVETSTNGYNWSKIGEVQAQGTSYNINDYQFVHTNPVIGVNYYRINMVDIDGSVEYSKIKPVLFENPMSSLTNVVVYPNPSNGILNISSLNKSNNYTLTDMHGKTIHSFNNTSENSDFQVNLSSYANGVYFIRAESNSGDIKVFKIILNK